jgi:hypothetical protein
MSGTFNYWVKGEDLTNTSLARYIFQPYGVQNEANFSFLHHSSTANMAFGGYGVNYFYTSAFLRDETNWYNMMWTWDTSNGTQNNRQRAYLNGVELTSMGSGTRSGVRQELGFGGNHQHNFLANYYPPAGTGADSWIGGHHAYTTYVNGLALDPTAFGEFKNGVWIPKNYETKPSLIAQNTGTAIGDLTGQSGLAGAFDTNRFESYSNAAASGSQATGYIGKNWGSSKTVTGFILYSPTQYGFVGSGASTFTVKLYGSNSNPSNSTDGTLLFTSSSVNDNLISTNGERGSIKYFADTTITSEETISDFTTDTAYSYHWVTITPNTSESIHVSEIEFYEDGNTYYGTGGFRLDYNASDLNTSGSSRTDPYGSSTDQPNNSIADASGSGNHLTKTTNIASTDFTSDSPENNFATFNALTPVNNGSITEGNLKYTSASSWGGSQSTFVIPSSGKWYVEFRIGSNTSNTAQLHFGIQQSGVSNGYTVTGYYGFEINNGFFTYVNGTYSGYTSGKSAGDFLQMAIDADNGKIYYGHNNTYYVNYNTTGGDPSGGSNPSASSLDFGATDFVIIVRSDRNNGVINFGQDGTFAGTETAQDNADANGNGNFYYAPPTGFLALCSANLPDVTIGPDSTTQADDYFNTLLYSGDGNSTQDVTGVGFQPDWTWIKERSSTSGHVVQDSNRGYDKFLVPQATNAESTGVINSVLSDGFQTTNSGVTNQSSQTYVAWNWKANGGTTSSNSDGSITSTVQASTTAGFSIVLYTGNGTNNSDVTIGHGLGVAPAWVILKSRDSTSSSDWIVWHKNLSADATYTTDLLFLNSNAAENYYSDQFKSVQDTTFTIRTVDATNGRVNQNTKKYVAYCFAEIEGYSKFGKYTGNGSTDGTFVYTGFRPAWVMIKQINSTGSWVIHDNKRSPFNVIDEDLFANLTSAESDNGVDKDFLSNGFKHKASHSAVNGSGSTYVYMAFAEQPFKFSNAR